MDVIFKTNGKGIWSNRKASVRILDMVCLGGYSFSDEGEMPSYGELVVVFDTKVLSATSWSTDKDGLIYTDPAFLKDLRAFLREHGLPGNDVQYSEQGMQGDSYVSLDVGKRFVKAWIQKFGALSGSM